MRTAVLKMLHYPIIFLLSSCAVVTGTAELMLDGVCAVTREKSYCAELPKPSEEPLVYLQRALNKLRDDVEADLKGFDSNTQKAEAILSFKNEDDFYIFPRSHVSDENTRAIEMKSNRALVEIIDTACRLAARGTQQSYLVKQNKLKTRYKYDYSTTCTLIETSKVKSQIVFENCLLSPSALWKI